MVPREKSPFVTRLVCACANGAKDARHVMSRMARSGFLFMGSYIFFEKCGFLYLTLACVTFLNTSQTSFRQRSAVFPNLHTLLAQS